MVRTSGLHPALISRSFNSAPANRLSPLPTADGAPGSAGTEGMNMNRVDHNEMHSLLPIDSLFD